MSAESPEWIAVVGAGAGLVTSVELAVSDLDSLIRDLTWKRDTLKKQAEKYRAAVTARKEALSLHRPRTVTEEIEAQADASLAPIAGGES